MTQEIYERIKYASQNRRNKPLRMQSLTQRSTFLAQTVLGFAVFFVSLGTIALFVHKNRVPQNDGTEIAAVDNAATTPFVQPEQIDENSPAVERIKNNNWDVRNDLSLIDRIAKLEQFCKELKHTQWLTILAINENANLNEKIDKKYHRNSDMNYINFDSNWNLNRIPKTMNFDHGEKKLLK